MNILIVSPDGDALALALALEREGHHVVISIHHSASQQAGVGLIEHVDDAHSWARDHADFVIYDMVGLGGQADALRDLDVPIFGGGRALDILELDRIRGLKLFKALGLAIPETEFFEDANFDRAIDFVQKDGGRWVFKPCGNAAADKTLVSEDAEEMVEFIEHERDHANGEDPYPAFCLQRFVPGIEVSLERWYSHGRPVPGLDNMTFEEKKFLAGNLGPAVGCMGNVVCDPPPALIAATVARMDRWAAAHNINSCLDLNCILEEKTLVPHVLEPTARFGYDALWAFLRRWKMPLGETFAHLATGEPVDVVLDRRMAAAVGVSVPPYPKGDPTQARDLPIVDPILDNPALWPGDVYLTDEGVPVVAGIYGVVYVVTALGTTPEDAYGTCYRWLKHSRLPDRQYRIDLADRVTKVLPIVRRWTGAERRVA